MGITFQKNDKLAFYEAISQLREDAKRSLPKGTRFEFRADKRSHMSERCIAWYHNSLFSEEKEWCFPVVDFADAWNIKSNVLGREET